MFSKTWTSKSTGDYSQKIERLKAELQGADAILIGAGSGLSTSAGLTYGGERFLKICIPAVSILFPLWGNTGLGGADTSITTVTM